MGNTGSGSKRDRTFSTETDPPSSPGKDDRAFEFSTSGSRKSRFIYQASLDDSDDFPSYKKTDGEMRPRSATLEGGTPTKTLLPTVFKWEGGGKDVSISGTFTNWKPIPMVHSHGDFVVILDVPEGDHQYKFKVDGHWVHDEHEPTVDNDLGTKNNLINVKASDFEVFEALAMDSVGSGSSQSISGSPPGDYGQEPAVRKPYEKSTGPPVLPPHLLQVILNKDVPLRCEPTLLPEPNHVMLNHLYALSIKDGVMVLSATHRYRKKYVTTLLYKPIRG
ncbi:5'-AMP-activated protein kinase subunit beta-1-like [Ornithodoros turicata]|uniref:5'-AMP-activated protein kinase subunit beta-1-like n=1 Tax=Ornithodoros turicata TaxID=34597 RepID=UPI00313930EE